MSLHPIFVTVRHYGILDLSSTAFLFRYHHWSHLCPGRFGICHHRQSFPNHQFCPGGVCHVRRSHRFLPLKSYRASLFHCRSRSHIDRYPHRLRDASLSGLSFAEGFYCHPPHGHIRNLYFSKQYKRPYLRDTA